MTCSTECTQFDLAMELLIENGFGGIAEAFELLMNMAMKRERSRHLNAGLHERKADRIGYANYKAKTMRTRLGEVEPAIPQTRGLSFILRALKIALTGLRRVKPLESRTSPKVTNAQSVRLKLCKALPDLILSGVYMPEMDGLELCATLQGNLCDNHFE